jgi:antitoxin component of RelBE/YafQ-DinJ toxin-antitoxin module
MTTITLAIEDEILEKLRLVAAERGATIDALVREALSQVAARGDISTDLRREQQEEARKGLLELSDNSKGRMAPDYKFNREELYDR